MQKGRIADCRGRGCKLARLWKAHKSNPDSSPGLFIARQSRNFNPQHNWWLKSAFLTLTQGHSILGPASVMGASHLPQKYLVPIPVSLVGGSGDALEDPLGENSCGCAALAVASGAAPLHGPGIFINISGRMFPWLNLAIAGCMKPKGYNNLTPDAGSFNS